MLLTGVWSLRIYCSAFFVVSLAKPILNPFPYVAGHVIQAECVCIELSYGRRVLKPIVSSLAQEIRLLATVRACMREDLVLHSGSRGVLPFRLGRQTTA